MADMMLPGGDSYAPDDILQGPEAQVPQMPQVQGAQDPQRFFQEQQAKAAELQQKAADNKAQQEDLMLGQRLVKLFDPNVPKPARDFLYKEMSRQMGVDPKGGHSQELGKMLLGLDPESMDSLRRNFAEKIPNAKPGEITGLIKGIMTGKVDGMALVQLASSPGGGQAEGGQDTTGGEGGPEPLPAAGGPDTRRLPTVGETPPEFQRVNPQLQHALGFNPAQRARTDDLLNEGYAIPTDPKEQQKLATEIQAGTAATQGLVTKAARLNALFAGKPEVLGTVGQVTRYIDSGIEQAKGALRAAGIMDDTNPDDLRKVARGILSRVEGAEKGTKIKRTAEEAALVESAMVDMAYSMATARGIPGNRLTNAMISQHLGELGKSGSPDQFQAVLADTVKRSIEQHDRTTSSKVGKAVPADLRGVSDADILTMAQNQAVLPKSYLERIKAEVQSRREGKSGQPNEVKRQSPTIEEEDATRRADAETARRRATREEEGKTQARRIQQQQEDRAARTEIRQESREERMTRAQEAATDLALRKEQRAEEKDRRARITLAFSELAKAIAGGRTSISGGGGGDGGGGGQNAEAFRITPGQTKRQAPQPVDAARFQRRG